MYDVKQNTNRKKKIRYLQKQTSEWKVIQVVLELNSMMAVGMNDLQQCSFQSSVSMSLLLKELPKASTVCRKG